MRARRRRRCSLAAAAVGCAMAWLAAVAPAVAAAELTGRIRVVEGRRAVADADSVVVWFVPDRRPAAARPGTFTMQTNRKRFEPRVLVVPVGSRVRFPNLDPILHNVFSVSGGNAFDLGLLGEGADEGVRFGEPGVVRVYCNVHHRMAGYVVVLDTPFHGSPAADGRFRLAGLPAGPGELVVWHERAEPLRRRLDPAAGPVSLTLELTHPLVPPHMNKFGRPYERNRRDRY